MMLMLLLTELARLEVHLSVASDGLHIQAPSGALTDELRQAMTQHKAALLRYAADPAIETIEGLGYLTGNQQEQDVTFVAQERKMQLCYKVGVVLLQDGIEHFYYPGMLSVGRNAGSDQSL
jgi:hypothetical protein